MINDRDDSDNNDIPVYHEISHEISLSGNIALYHYHPIISHYRDDSDNNDHA